MASVLDYVMLLVRNTNVFTTALVFMCTFLLVFYNTRRQKGVPPGPPLFPVIGNLPNLVGGDIFQTLNDLRQKYGDIFGLYVGRELLIFLNGYEVVHDALVKRGTLFVNRPFSSFHKQVIKNPAIVYANGQLWKEQRTFMQKALQELCFRNGGRNIERIVNTEITNIVEELGERIAPFDIEDVINISVANVISTIVYKHRFELGDKIFLKLLKDISEGASEFADMTVRVNCLPFLAHFPGDLLKLKANIKRQARHVDPLKPYINAIKQNNGSPDNVVSLYMNCYKNNIQNGTTDTLTEKQMEHTCCEILAVGSETTATTLRWIFLYLVRKQDIQNKLYQEIEKEIGTTRSPTLEDRKRLPLAEAVILEGLRIAPAAPLAIPHTVSHDLIFHGYVIPENSTVMVNIVSCHKDPLIWKDPEEFCPERFLNESGTEVSIPKQFIPFSLGKRSCTGETLAKMELFLFLTSLVQKFKFEPVDAENLPSTKGKLGLTWSPLSFKTQLKKR